MAIHRPFKRTCRQFTHGSYSHSGQYQYLFHPDYAKSPEHYIRAFLLIQKDLQSLFDYIEPADLNSNCYSYRIHELLLRTCVEVEANCKAILLENRYKKNGDLTMSDFKKINKSHHLSSYEIKLPLWHGSKSLRTPFLRWATGESLSWYQAYNKTKHDRHDKFNLASFENLIDAVCGLVTVLASQFWTEDYSPESDLVALGNSSDDMETAIGGYFRVKFPDDWSEEEMYDFTIGDIEKSKFTIECYDYNSL